MSTWCVSATPNSHGKPACLIPVQLKYKSRNWWRHDNCNLDAPVPPSWPDIVKCSAFSFRNTRRDNTNTSLRYQLDTNARRRDLHIWDRRWAIRPNLPYTIYRATTNLWQVLDTAPKSTTRVVQSGCIFQLYHPGGTFGAKNLQKGNWFCGILRYMSKISYSFLSFFLRFFHFAKCKSHFSA